jgi:hypothetical protein
MLAGYFALASNSWAESAAPCSGPNKMHHSYGNFDFETNSRADPVKFRQYKAGLVSCVSNNDKTNPLYAHWLIPGPRGWVPANDKLESTPRLIENEKVEQFGGCLRYGNRGDTTSANFLGIASDRSAVDEEKKNGCRATTPSSGAQAKEATIEDIVLKIRNFFPSNSKEPQATMLQLDGEVGIKTTGPNQYQSFFRYVLSRYKDTSGGAIERMSVRPAFRGALETLLQSYVKDNPPRLKMREKGYIAFAVSGIEAPVLRYASYEIYDQNEQLVGAIDFPVFVSSRK